MIRLAALWALASLTLPTLNPERKDLAMSTTTKLLQTAAIASGIAIAVLTTTAFRGVDTDFGVYDSQNRWVGQPAGEDYMLKPSGDAVTEDELLAENRQLAAEDGIVRPRP
jgi:hypothetical protein